MLCSNFLGLASIPAKIPASLATPSHETPIAEASVVDPSRGWHKFWLNQLSASCSYILGLSFPLYQNSATVQNCRVCQNLLYRRIGGLTKLVIKNKPPKENINLLRKETMSLRVEVIWQAGSAFEAFKGYIVERASHIFGVWIPLSLPQVTGVRPKCTQVRLNCMECCKSWHSASMRMFPIYWARISTTLKILQRTTLRYQREATIENIYSRLILIFGREHQTATCLHLV